MNQVVPASEALASRADSAVSVANRTIPIYGDSKLIPRGKIYIEVCDEQILL